DTRFMDFFYSRRRRHTRSKRDWSSDVCSSDLTSKKSNARWRRVSSLNGNECVFTQSRPLSVKHHTPREILSDKPARFKRSCAHRSEERRVGKGCGCLWWRCGWI